MSHKDSQVLIFNGNYILFYTKLVHSLSLTKLQKKIRLSII